MIMTQSNKYKIWENFNHKRVRIDYGKKCNMRGPVAWDCISNKIKPVPLHMFSSSLKWHRNCLLGIDSYVRYMCGL